MDEGQTHSSSHSLSDSLGYNLGDTHIFGALTSSSKETRGLSIGVSEELPEGYEKVIIKLNEWAQPNEPKEEVDDFITKLGHIARRDIPICYDSWKPVRAHESIIPKAIKALGRILRNTENRKQQKNSSCLGRKSAAVAEVEMTKEKGVPVSSITRLDQYMDNNKKKNGEHQDSELAENLNDYTVLHPESRETSVNDALTKNLALKEINTNLEKRVDVIQNVVLENTTLLREFMSQGRMPMADVESPCSSHASPVVNEYIGKECDLRGGWLLRVVVRGIMQDIDPNTEFGNRRLEEGNFKVHVNVVYDGGAVLPLPHDDWKSKLGEVAQGSVIWPKELLML
ncbi:hypothetical protein IFM89_006053 [Coptis chinensis]|uniref:DUF8039 domain-containing protein n=1 Tax=Coptis chinensis TaxID=261450 RepID=A0A835H4P6_9MAGN|nr:hypothetical protein IFM89_006053 [Coptis chinensis]